MTYDWNAPTEDPDTDNMTDEQIAAEMSPADRPKPYLGREENKANQIYQELNEKLNDLLE